MFDAFPALLALVADGPPDGGVSPLAWTIIGGLSSALVAVSVFARGWASRLYADLKECNTKRLESEEEVLGLLKVLRVHMEKAKGGGKSR